MPFGSYGTGGGTVTIPSTQATDVEVATAVTDHNNDTTSVHGIPDTVALATDTDVSDSVDAHSADTDPHGDRAYADAVAAGLRVKDSVVAATTGNITLSGAQTIDGVSVVALDRVLVKAQTLSKNDGIYIAAAGAWSRSTDADTAAEVTAGMFAFVTSGTVNAASSWVQTAAVATLGTDAMSFSQFGAGTDLSAGAGLLKTGTTFDVQAADASITVAADAISTTFGNATTQAFGDAAVNGTAASSAHSDHKHAMPNSTTGPDADITVDASGAAGTSATAARSAHGHKLSTYTTAAAAVGTAAAGTSTDAPSRGSHVHPTGAGTPTTAAFADAAAIGSGPAAAMTNHVHGMPAAPTAASVGSPALSTIDAAGDLYIGTGNDTVTKLTKGTQYAQLTAGASTVSYQFNNGPVLNVDDQTGITGDGGAEDSTYIQAAIDLLPSGGGTIVLGRNKKYKVTGTQRTINPSAGAVNNGDGTFTFSYTGGNSAFTDDDVVNVLGVVSSGNNNYNSVYRVSSHTTTSVTVFADNVVSPGTYTSGGTITKQALMVRDKAAVKFTSMGGQALGSGSGGSFILPGNQGTVCLVFQKTSASTVMTHSGPIIENIGFEDTAVTAANDTANTGAYSGGTITISGLSTGHGFIIGDSVYVSGSSVNGYDGVHTLTASSTNTIGYAASDPGASATGIAVAYDTLPAAKSPTSIGVVICGTTRWDCSRMTANGMKFGFLLLTSNSKDTSWGGLHDYKASFCKVAFKCLGNGGQSVNIDGGVIAMHTGQVGFQGPNPEETNDLNHFRCTNFKFDTQTTSATNTMGFDIGLANYAYIGHHSFEMEGDSSMRAVRLGLGQTNGQCSGTIVGIHAQHNKHATNMNGSDGVAIEVGGSSGTAYAAMTIVGGQYTNFAEAVHIGPYAEGTKVIGGNANNASSGGEGVVIEDATTVIGCSATGFTSNPKSTYTILDIPASSDFVYRSCWDEGNGSPLWWDNTDFGGTLTGQLRLSGAVNTVTVTGSQVDRSVTNSVYRWNGASACTIHGFQGVAEGRVIFVENVTAAQTLTLANDSATETTATRRIKTGDEGDLLLGPNSSVILEYDATLGFWRVVGRNTYSSAAAAIGTAAAGTAGVAPARGDHVHATGAGTPSTQAFGDAAAVGSGPAAAMTNHKHAMPSLATNALVLGTAAAAGSAATVIRSDDTINAFDATAPTQTVVQATGASVGTAAKAARRDHVHDIGTHSIAEHTDVTRSWFLQVGAAPANQDGGTNSSVGTAPNLIQRDTLTDGATQGFFLTTMTPRDWSTGVIQYTILWSPNSTDASAHSVAWSTDVLEVPAGTDVTATGTTSTFTGTAAARTQNVLVVESTQTLLTPSAANTLLRVDIRRVGGDVADTYVGNISVVGIRFDYTATQ